MNDSQIVSFISGGGGPHPRHLQAGQAPGRYPAAADSYGAIRKVDRDGEKRDVRRPRTADAAGRSGPGAGRLGRAAAAGPAGVEARVTAHSGRVGLASELTEPGRVDHGRDARRETGRRAGW